MQLTNKVITIDGPSGVGKGTLAKELATRLGCDLLDSGAIYRALAWKLQQDFQALPDIKTMTQYAKDLPLTFKLENGDIQVFCNGKNINSAIRTENIGKITSQIAALPEIRAALLERQRAFANNNANGLIADGRDMGTIVFPDAPIKIFLDASNKERAKRRFKQLQQKQINVTFEQILADISERDQRDRSRSVSPLIAATDAMIIDSTSLSIAEVIDLALSFIHKRICK